ncbi:PTS glucitol/sorbitol transporter subunit IIA [Enterococcus dongliensis]|uniref:PTS glucitol/sorbitol transporter subunit IIA n=1 Tax=Enterococcus dongliensis TaxID=2559925 RepID=A0AAP5NMK2_9ENTE|nr:PTS glucitol/sorbitol transporter subunit IIA [Enterococcus dongliensis]MDT2597540.1 PTS glucitol/sorbitol transporter subunit IIA [Enterococcus dongliensis]MDT2604735.1 PTS glucitol/sorbitol transporter subunit IIA [Enterococcus dongliensis]MDT2635351.1 PTS glucitol/sorbitol transporter subunit IIA [Enterococcus dongliensis]MDT2638263.1 PTS glucitol/sorbitol transporter subunit IIA [Enterococcus dongliensis]MDT2643315.1 PTS glucitol/sorbitol transporter subunit IIA [Enterococcus dongliensi
MVKTKITEIGSMVPAFEEERLIILFGPKATPELRDISVIHEVEEQPNDSISIGGKLKIGNKEYTIEEVGSQANSNFDELGHISIYFRNEVGEILPGAIIVSPGEFPSFEVGDEIEFI